MQFVLVGQDHAIAFRETVYSFREIERAITHLDSASVHNAALYDQGLINE
jgi:hypothetical protein